MPLANSPSTSVLPNLMYVLDDSGSMQWNWMPDQMFRTSGGQVYNHCRKCTTNTVTGTSNSACRKSLGVGIGIGYLLFVARRSTDRHSVGSSVRLKRLNNRSQWRSAAAWL